MSKDLMGRELFADGLTFSRLREMHENGGKFKTTNLTESFTYRDFLDRNGDDAVLLGVVREDGTLRLNTVDDPLEPVAGQQVIALSTTVQIPDGHRASNENNADDKAVGLRIAGARQLESGGSELTQSSGSILGGPRPVREADG